MSAAWTSSALAQLRRDVSMECTLGLYMDLYIPPYRINNEQIFTPTKEAVLKQPRTVKAEQ